MLRPENRTRLTSYVLQPQARNKKKVGLRKASEDSGQVALARKGHHITILGFVPDYFVVPLKWAYVGLFSFCQLIRGASWHDDFVQAPESRVHVQLQLPLSSPYSAPTCKI